MHVHTHSLVKLIQDSLHAPPLDARTHFAIDTELENDANSQEPFRGFAVERAVTTILMKYRWQTRRIGKHHIPCRQTYPNVSPCGITTYLLCKVNVISWLTEAFSPIKERNQLNIYEVSFPKMSFRNERSGVIPKKWNFISCLLQNCLIKLNAKRLLT